MGREERKRRGKVGRDWAIENGFTHKAMCDYSINAIDICFKSFKPRQRYILIDTDKKEPENVRGELI